MPKWARMRDGNEGPIVKALEAVGAVVVKLDGKGTPDLLVGYRAQMFLLEVKRPAGPQGGRKKQAGGASRVGSGGDGVLTAAQIDWHRKWTGPKVPIVTTPEEALAAIGYTLVVPQPPEPAVYFVPGDAPVPMRCSSCSMTFDARSALHYADGVHPPVHWFAAERTPGGKIPICAGHRLPALPIIEEETEAP